MIRRLLGSIFICSGLGLSLLLQGCVANPAPPPRAAVWTPHYHYGPSPFYYYGHVVYYDRWGQPIYFSAGSWYRVPLGYRHYRPIVRHYREHLHDYRQRPQDRRRHPLPRAPRAGRQRQAGRVR
jgi:hypothetical protein